MRPGQAVLLQWLFIVATLSLTMSACATKKNEPNPLISASDRASLQNECAQIADRSERETCLEKAAFAKRW